MLTRESCVQNTEYNQRGELCQVISERRSSHALRQMSVGGAGLVRYGTRTRVKDVCFFLCEVASWRGNKMGVTGEEERRIQRKTLHDVDV